MSTQPPPLIIHQNVIKAGQHTILMLPMPKLYDWTPLSMPVHIIHGKVTGPTLCVTAAVHGDEVNGVEIVRRLLKKKRVLKNIKGTLIAIPVVNLYGFLNQNRYLMDRRDLNRSFPGSEKGSLAARLAHLLTKDILSHATHIIDLHSGSLQRTNLPQIRTNLDMPGMRSLAQAFNVPVVLHANLRDGSMREYASDRSIPFLLYESGEALRFDELSIRAGVNGILGVMQSLQMIPTIQKPTSNKIETAFARSSYWIRAPYSGILHSFKKLGRSVNKNETVAKIGNPTSIEEHPVISPISGIVIGKSNQPMINAGAALLHVACFEARHLVEEQIEYLRESHTDWIEGEGNK